MGTIRLSSKHDVKGNLRQGEEKVLKGVTKTRVRREQEAARRARDEQVEVYMEHLKTTIPVLFDPERAKPLKIGAGNELAKSRPEGTSHATARAALKRWTSSPAYLRALAAGGSRYGLDGEPIGEVTEEHQRAARARLAALKSAASGHAEDSSDSS